MIYTYFIVYITEDGRRGRCQIRRRTKIKNIKDIEGIEASIGLKHDNPLVMTYKLMDADGTESFEEDNACWTKGIPQQDGWYWLKDSNPNKERGDREGFIVRVMAGWVHSVLSMEPVRLDKYDSEELLWFKLEEPDI